MQTHLELQSPVDTSLVHGTEAESLNTMLENQSRKERMALPLSSKGDSSRAKVY